MIKKKYRICKLEGLQVADCMQEEKTFENFANVQDGGIV